MTYQHQLHVSVIAAVAIVRLDTIYQRSYIYIYIYMINDLYCSPNIVQVIKSRRMKWAGHVARMGEERGVYRVLVGIPGGKETTVVT